MKTKTAKFKTIDGIKCYAEKYAHVSDGYNPEQFKQLFQLEEGNFWFRIRNRIIRNLIIRFLDRGEERKYLEIGCGTGFVLKGISDLKNLKLLGSELHLDGLKFAAQRLPNVEFVQLDARSMPFTAEFDGAGAFDVIEHIDEDLDVMRNVHQALKPGGLFFISVPQHMWLWSEQDVAAVHKRRYSRREMRDKLEQTGYRIEFIGSFMFLLLPLMFLSRLRFKKSGSRPADEKADEYDFSEFRIPGILNKIFEWILSIEVFLIKLGVSFPAGGSLLVVARKA